MHTDDAALSALMVAALSGDENAYRTLLRRCIPIVAARARQRGVRGDLVDDVVQDTLLTVHRARVTFDTDRSLLAWLRAMADRRSIDAMRRRTRQQRETYDPVAYDTHPDPAHGIWNILQSHDKKAALSEALSRLPPGQREAVEYLKLQERSLDETAVLTGRSKGALKVDLHRALKNLRASIERAASWARLPATSGSSARTNKKGGLPDRPLDSSA